MRMVFAIFLVLVILFVGSMTIVLLLYQLGFFGVS